MGTFTIDSLQKRYVLILVLCVGLFPLFIGSVSLFDWDEINFAEIAREMLLTHKYFTVQLNYQPFWEKPPLFFWIQALSGKVFGMNEFASRLPNTLVGGISIFLIYHFGKKFFEKRFGFIWAIAYVGSFLPHFYFKTGIIDPLFNLLIVSSLYHFYIFSLSPKSGRLLIATTLLGLAFLTKGPVAILVVALCMVCFVIYKRGDVSLRFTQVLWAFCLFIGICSIWVIPEILKGGGVGLFQEFIAYQIRLFSTSEAGHGQPFYYHPLVLFWGCFPVSILALPSLLGSSLKRTLTSAQASFLKLHLILFWVVLILFSVTTTKIVHYSSLCYFPLTFLGTFVIDTLLKQSRPLPRFLYRLFIFTGVCLSLLFILLPLLFFYRSKTLVRWIADDFVQGNLNVDVAWSGYEWIVGFLFLCGFVWLCIKLSQNVHYLFFLFVFNALLVNALLWLVVPKVEQHVQGSLIDFLKAHRHEYVTSYGFKSYAIYFYTDKMPPSHPQTLPQEWLLSGAIDKPVYLVAKIGDKGKVLALSHTRLLYEAGGFVFCRRDIGTEIKYEK